MDVRSPSPSRTRELAALRLRAYGPDADIHDDPTALARLHELESEFRAGTEADEGLSAEPPGETSESPSNAGPAASGDVDASAPRDDQADETHTDAAPRRLWWRAVPAWALVAAGIIVGAAAGAAVVSAAQPHPDFVLRATPDQGRGDEAWERTLQSSGLSPGTATPYGLYNGVAVWTASSDDGARCLVLAKETQPVSVSCVGAGFDPVLDLMTYAGMDRIFDDPPAAGSVVRFVARDGSVEVWLRERQTIDSSWSVSVPSV